eukprot:UN02330
MADEHIQHKNEPFIKQWISKHNLRYQYHHLKEWDASLIRLAMNGEMENIQTVLIEKAHFDRVDAILLAVDLIVQFNNNQIAQFQQQSGHIVESIQSILYRLWDYYSQYGTKSGKKD